MDWRCGSSRRAPALQTQSPEFNPQFHRKKVKGKKKPKKPKLSWEMWLYSFYTKKDI
jgi:hypothetical protein